MAAIFTVYNGAMATTSSSAKVSTGTSLKTMLQLKLNAGVVGRLIEWGASFDGSAAATPGIVECLETGTVFGTVTAFVANDISRVNGDAMQISDPTTALVAVGTSASGYTCTSEGSIAASRLITPPQLVAPTSQQIIQYPLDEEGILIGGNCYRIRANFGAAISCLCYMKFAI